MTTFLALNREGSFPAGSRSATLADSLWAWGGSERPSPAASPKPPASGTSDLTWVLRSPSSECNWPFLGNAVSRSRGGPPAAPPSPHPHKSLRSPPKDHRCSITEGQAHTLLFQTATTRSISMWANTPEGFLGPALRIQHEHTKQQFVKTSNKCSWRCSVRFPTGSKSESAMPACPGGAEAAETADREARKLLLKDEAPLPRTACGSVQLVPRECHGGACLTGSPAPLTKPF